MSFNNYIRERSKELGLKQTDIAKSLGVSKQAVSKWFNGQTNPDKWLLPGLADILKVDVKELTGWFFDEPRILVNPGALAEKKKKSVYKLFSAPDLMVEFPEMGFSQDEGKTFSIVCDEDTVDSFMEEHADGNGIKLVYPNDKKEKIIKERSAGWKSYEKEELFDFFLDDCLKKYRADILIGGARKIYGDAVKSVIISKYKKTVTFEKLKALLELSDAEYDAYHKNLCEELVETEKFVIENPIFDGDISYKDDRAFFNAQYILNTLAQKAFEYDFFDEYHGFFADGKLHTVITGGDLKKNNISLKTYDGYAAAQETFKHKIAECGIISRYQYDLERHNGIKNPLNYSSIDEYMESLDGLSKDELLNELWRCRKLNSVIDNALNEAVCAAENFINNNFYTRYNQGDDFHGEIRSLLEYRIREEELRDDDLDRCKDLLKAELKKLFDEYIKLRKKVKECKNYGNNKKYTGNEPKGDIKGAIIEECFKMSGRAKETDGCYIKFNSFVNDLGVHVCSWYYHLTGETLDPDSEQTVKSDKAKNMLFRFKDDGRISFADTIEPMKAELRKMIEKACRKSPK